MAARNNIIPGSRSQPNTGTSQVRAPYLPELDANTQQELLIMRQQLQQLTQQMNQSGKGTGTGGGANSGAKGGDPLSAEQMDFIRKNLQIGGSHPLNLTGLLKGY